MKRLLCIISCMNTGGAETFLMKIYRKLDRTHYQMDFCVTSEENYYADEIYSLGGKIYHIPPKSKYPLKSFLSIKNLVKKENYQYVIRVNEHSLSVLDLIAAKMGGAKRLIMRSSNSSSGSKMSIILHKLFKFLPAYVPDVKMAPSTLAAEYTFGKRNVRRDEVILLNNGLDIDKFAYSIEAREKIRKEFNIESKFVIGHIGRFNEQKNHEFLLEIFDQVLAVRDNAVLLMVGNGNLIDDIQSKARKKGIYDKCIFAGIRSDINEILSAMDVFVFPSFYEGMPNTVIEAQASGLPCVISDTITREVKIIDNVCCLSLGNESVWANSIIDFEACGRKDVMTEFLKAGYDIKSVANVFQEIVFEGED